MSQRKQFNEDDEDPYYRTALLGQMKPPGGTAADPMQQPQGAPGAEMPGSPIADAPAATAAPPVNNFGRTMGFDEGKFNDPNKHDFKYDTGRVMSQFDPRQGFTPDVIDALNKLDYGTFSGAGDKLSLSGAKNAKDAADFSNQDWIYGLKDNSAATKWNFGGGGAAPADAPGGMAGGPGMGGQPQIGAIDQLGDLAGGGILQKIQQALAQYMKG